MKEIPPGVPYLEHYSKGCGAARRVPLDHLPFTIGRVDSARLKIDSTQVSREHAEIVRHQGKLYVRDLGSTNGTFVNGRRIQECPLAHGDILQIADTELTFHCGKSVPAEAVVTQVMGGKEARQSQATSAGAVIRAARRFQEALLHGGLRIVLQRLSDLNTGECIGHRAVRETPPPAAAWSTIEQQVLDGESRLTLRLNRLLRVKAVEASVGLPGSLFFVPLKAHELDHDDLEDDLQRLARIERGKSKLVIELDEQAAGNDDTIRRIRQILEPLDMALAFARFAAGKSRLVELARQPPEYLLLDPSFVRGIAGARARHRLAAELMRACDDYGLQVIAVGIESRDDAQAWRELGCQFGGGTAWEAIPPLAAAAGATHLLHAPAS